MPRACELGEDVELGPGQVHFVGAAVDAALGEVEVDVPQRHS